jgi:hypothetical protein
VLSRYKMPSQIEQIGNGSVSSKESSRLFHRFELSHPSLPDSGRLMRLLCPIILILFSAMNHIRHQLTVSNSIAPQLVSHDLSGLSTVTSQ